MERIKNRYEEFKKRHAKELNKLPMKVAFGQKQFEEMLEEWGLTTSDEDLKKIISLLHGSGCYCLKKDAHLFSEYFKRIKEEQKEFLKDDKNLKDAFIYEFANHECGYTYQPQDALLALSLTYNEVMMNKRLHRVFKSAWRKYLTDYDKTNKHIREIY